MSSIDACNILNNEYRQCLQNSSLTPSRCSHLELDLRSCESTFKLRFCIDETISLMNCARKPDSTVCAKQFLAVRECNRPDSPHFHFSNNGRIETVEQKTKFYTSRISESLFAPVREEALLDKTIESIKRRLNLKNFTENKLETNKLKIQVMKQRCVSPFFLWSFIYPIVLATTEKQRLSFVIDSYAPPDFQTMKETAMLSEVEAQSQIEVGEKPLLGISQAAMNWAVQEEANRLIDAFVTVITTDEPYVDRLITSCGEELCRLRSVGHEKFKFRSYLMGGVCQSLTILEHIVSG